MPYQPFTLEDHPKILKAVDRYFVDYLAQRSTRNIRYHNGELWFDIHTMTEVTHHHIVLDDDAFRPADYEITVLRSLRFALENLAAADKVDVPRSHARFTTEYEVIKAFKFFNQIYGGRRYVELCRDLVEGNRGKCIEDFMNEDLIVDIYSGFNKNVGKDVDGLIDAIVDILDEWGFSNEELTKLYVVVSARSSPSGASRLAESALANPRLRASMEEFVTEGYVPSRCKPRVNYPSLLGETVASFSEENLTLIMKNLPSGMAIFAMNVLAQCPEPMREKAVTAYMENPDRDVAKLLALSYFGSLSPELKARIMHAKVFSKNAQNKDLILFYESLSDDEARADEIAFCRNDGRIDLTNALEGKPFSMKYFSSDELLLLAPHINLQDPAIAKELSSYLKRAQRGKDTDALFLLLEGPLYEDIVRQAVDDFLCLSLGTRLCLMERFHLLPYGTKEWRYHA